MTDSSPFKRCPTCNAEKPRTEFWRQAKAKDGLQYKCKTCDAAYKAEHRAEIAVYHAIYRTNHREERAALNAGYRAEHRAETAFYKAAYKAEHHEEIAAYHAAYRTEHHEEIASYRAEHREEIAAYNAAYRAEHPEETAVRNTVYGVAHRDQRAANQRNREARKRGNGGTHTSEDIQAQYDRQKGRCYWCSEKAGDAYHVDHVTPLAKGGSNGPENLVIACPTCNLSKGGKHVMDFCGRLL